MKISDAQARVVGCLIEKAATTPDSYPLSSNALTNACNQSTNRDPVVDYSEREVDALMLELRELKLARTVHGSGHRVGKHKHVVDETLGLDHHELAVLTVLLLRGAQTLNEITSRTARYGAGPGGDEAAVDAAIDRLAARHEPLAIRLPRQRGEREPRTDQCWTDGAGPASAPISEPIAVIVPDLTEPARSGESRSERPDSATSVSGPDLASRVEALEAELAAQTARIDKVLEELGLQ